MFEGQPKGLYALALANTGERFGYYTMLAIFTLFLQAKIWLHSSRNIYYFWLIFSSSLFYATCRRYFS